MNLLWHGKRSKINIVLSLLLLSYWVGSAKAEESKVPIEVQNYSSALKNFQRRSNREPIEPVYALGIAAANKLTLVLEELNTDEFNLVKDQMQGFTVNRVEAVIVDPNADFWKNLAKQKGQDVDIAFFNLLHWIKPHGRWPIYIMQLDDVSGCTKHGSGLLVDVYGKLQQFQQSYSSAYKVHTEKILGDIEMRLTFDTRSCGTANELMSEMELFVRTYPASEISQILKRRIQEMGKSK